MHTQGNDTHDEETCRLIKKALEAHEALNEAAAHLTYRGFTVRVNGWTSPGMIGNVRLQGNTGLTIDGPQS